MQTLLKLVGNFAQGICRIHPSSGDHKGVGVHLEWLIDNEKSRPVIRLERPDVKTWLVIPHRQEVVKP